MLIFFSGKWFINGSISPSALNNQYLFIVYYWSIWVLLSCLLFKRVEKCDGILEFYWSSSFVYFIFLLFLLFFWFWTTSRKWATVKIKASAVAVRVYISIFFFFFPVLGSKFRLQCVTTPKTLLTVIKLTAEFVPFIQRNVTTDNHTQVQSSKHI